MNTSYRAQATHKGEDTVTEYKYTNKTQKYIDLESTWGAPNYLPIPVCLDNGEGCWVRDVEGNKYLDMMAAYSALSFGYKHPKIIKALHEQADKLAVTSRAYYTTPLAAFLQKVCEITGMDKALPMNTGAEAVETAIKCVRRWGYDIKGIPEGKAEIIVADHNFHGRTTTIISFSSESDYRRGFGPLTPGFKHVPFNDPEALEAAITENTCAFIVEPIQGEAGIITPDHTYHQRVQEICNRHNVLYILDEVQSGLGRTGRNFAAEYYGVQPDGMMLGKALGGGLLPISVFLAKDEVMTVFAPGSHGSTFGGNPLAAHVASVSLHVLEEEKLAERAAQTGAYMKEQLLKINSKLIDGVRGVGLWFGVDINPRYASARDVCEAMARFGVLSKETHKTVVRFAPPLIITKEEIDYGMERLAAALKSLE